MEYPTNSDDVIDSRNVIEAITELEDGEAADELDESEQETLNALRALRYDAEGYSDWTSGAVLVRESHFVDYARQYADDVCALDSDSSMYPYVDWERWARDLRRDYTAVEFDGETYYVR